MGKIVMIVFLVILMMATMNICREIRVNLIVTADIRLLLPGFVFYAMLIARLATGQPAMIVFPVIQRIIAMIFCRGLSARANAMTDSMGSPTSATLAMRAVGLVTDPIQMIALAAIPHHLFLTGTDRHVLEPVQMVPT